MSLKKQALEDSNLGSLGKEADLSLSKMLFNEYSHVFIMCQFSNLYSIHIFDLHYDPLKWKLLLHPFYKWEHLSTNWLSVQLVIDRVGI